MNYEDMSDLEINKAVACKLGLRFFIKPNSNGNQTEDWIYGGIGSPHEMTELADYCNSWADMGPLIFRTPIDIECDDTFFGDNFIAGESLWVAHNPNGSHYHHKNPLRAAAIVYLMMENEK